MSDGKCDFKNNRRYTIAAMATSPDGTTSSSNFTVEVLYHNFQGPLTSERHREHGPPAGSVESCSVALRPRGRQGLNDTALVLRS